MVNADVLATKVFSAKQEKIIADCLGWEVVPGSGARDCHPGDIRSEEWLGECKTHTKPTNKITFHKSVWNKIAEEAMSTFKKPILFVDNGTQTLDNTWCIVPKLILPVEYVRANCVSINVSGTKNIVIDNYKLDTKLPEGKSVYLNWQGEYVLLMKLFTFSNILIGDYEV